MPQGVKGDPNASSKVCSRCSTAKPLSDFHRNASASDGRMSHCKECAKAKNLAEREAHPERFVERAARKRERYARDPSASQRSAEQGRQWRAANPETVRARTERQRGTRVNDPEKNRRHWLANYNLTPEEYDKLLLAQDGTCAICDETCSRYANLPVDHNHATGRLRGLLCDRCNRVLGLSGDDPDLFLAAIAYLTDGGVIQRDMFVPNPDAFTRRRRAREQRRAEGGGEKS